MVLLSLEPTAPRSAGALATARERRDWPSYVTPGWYVAALSSDVGPAETKPISVAGRPLALVRTQSGRCFILDRYCAHQGASLAAGKVLGDVVQCPFHHWQFDRSGHCANIPGCAKIPKGAHVQAHATEERFGFVWVFIGQPEQARRHPLPSMYEVDPASALGHVRAKSMGLVRTVPRDITENVVDQGHVSSVHGVKDRPPDAIKFEFTPGRFHSEFSVLMLKQPIEGYTTLHPPSFWWTALSGFGRLGMPFHATAWLFALRPVGPELTECYSSCYVDGNRWNPLNWTVGQVLERLWTRGFMQDVRVWDDKVVRENPLLCGIDTGPIMQFRRWWAAYERDLRGPASESVQGRTESLSEPGGS